MRPAAADNSTRWSIPRLLGLVPGDFFGNGRMDAVAMSAHPHCDDTVVLHLCNHSFCCRELVSAQDQVLAIDINGDHRVDRKIWSLLAVVVQAN